MSDHVYSYYRVNVPEKTDGCREGGTGFVAARIDRPDKGAAAPFEYRVTFAFCSPLDNFSRPTAHRLTKLRAVDPAHNRSIKIKSAHKLTSRAVALRAFTLALTGKNPNIQVPCWLKAACLFNLQPYSRGR